MKRSTFIKSLIAAPAAIAVAAETEAKPLTPEAVARAFDIPPMLGGYLVHADLADEVTEAMRTL